VEEEGVAGARVPHEPVDVRHNVAARRQVPPVTFAVVAQDADVLVTELRASSTLSLGV
jgi:hypothetical protein